MWFRPQLEIVDVGVPGGAWKEDGDDLKGGIFTVRVIPMQSYACIPYRSSQEDLGGKLKGGARADTNTSKFRTC